MEGNQQDFIEEKLNQIVICTKEEINKFTNDLNNISIPTVKNILKNHYMNGADMKALFCLFSTVILSTKTSKEVSGLYKLSFAIQNWI